MVLLEFMAKEEKILTLHPEGKKGVSIAKYKYDVIKDFILKTLKERTTITYKELNDLAVKQLSEKFEGKVNWYVVVIKLDLEARKIIERMPKTTPHQIRLMK